MKKKGVIALIFIVLFTAGIYFISESTQMSDKATLTNPYNEGAEVFVPPNTKKVDNFDTGGMALATADMATFVPLSLTGSQNFVKTSIGGGSGGL